MFGRLKERLTGGAKRLSGRTDLLEGIAAASVLGGAADGDLSDDEAMVALDRLKAHEALSAAFTATQIEQAFDKQAARAKQGLAGRIGLRREIEQVGSSASEEDREMLLVIAIDVVCSDGDISEAERKALNTIGQAVNLPVARYLE